MALFRKFFYRKPPDGLLEISERVYVFDCCFSSDVVGEDDYMGGVVRHHFPDASFMVFNFWEGDGEGPSQILSEDDVTVMDYPGDDPPFPQVQRELALPGQPQSASHALRPRWLARPRLHARRPPRLQEAVHGRAAHSGHDLQAGGTPHPLGPHALSAQIPPLRLPQECGFPMASPRQATHLGLHHYQASAHQCPPYSQNLRPHQPHSQTSLLNTKQTQTTPDCELVKLDIHCVTQGDVVLECISLDDDLKREVMMFRVMFNTAFIRSNILMLNRDEIDILWDSKDRFPKEFRAEVLFSDVDAADSLISVELPTTEEKEGLPVEAFAKVQEIFSNVDWLDPKADAVLSVLQQINTSSILQEKLDKSSLVQNLESGILLNEVTNGSHQDKLTVESEGNIKSTSTVAPEKYQLLPNRSSAEAELTQKKVQPQDLQVALQRSTQSNIITQGMTHSSLSSPVSHSSSLQGSPLPMSRYHSAPSALGITALLHDHASYGNTGFTHPNITSSQTFSVSSKLSLKSSSAETTVVPLALSPPHLAVTDLSRNQLPVPPPSLPASHTNINSSSQLKYLSSVPPSMFEPPLSDTRVKVPQQRTQLPSPPPPPAPLVSDTNIRRSLPPQPPAAACSPPPPPPPLPPPPHSPPTMISTAGTPSPPPPLPPKVRGTSPHSMHSTSAPPPPPTLAFNHIKSSCAPPVLPPPAPFTKGVTKPGGSRLQTSGPPTPSPPPFSKGRGLAHSANPKNQQSAQSKKTTLKPLHWLKLTRAMQGSLWAETQKLDENSKAPEFDMSELESLFSATVPPSERGISSDKSSRRASVGGKSDKVQLIDLRRAYNCEIMLTKVKIPLPDLMSSVLALDDSALDVDQVDNLIKFCPTKEEMELLKGYSGEKENLGKCEQFFLELMKVPRVESKLRVFSFRIQFLSQVSELRSNLNIVNSASEEIRNSAKLKRIMQTILSLGNALNRGTARGSAIGFRLDSLLKLTDTRARNNKMTLMHYLCKVLADKLPELLDFHKDLVSLESATKIQLKYLAEEMQAISKGLEKVEQELTASENDGPISHAFHKTLKEFLKVAEGEVRSLASLYSGVGRNADALALYFGEDPARCPFEQVVSTLMNFVRMFGRAHEDNGKQLELERKRAQKESENNKK